MAGRMAGDRIRQRFSRRDREGDEYGRTRSRNRPYHPTRATTLIQSLYESITTAPNPYRRQQSLTIAYRKFSPTVANMAKTKTLPYHEACSFTTHAPTMVCRLTSYVMVERKESLVAVTDPIVDLLAPVVKTTTGTATQGKEGTTLFVAFSTTRTLEPSRFSI